MSTRQKSLRTHQGKVLVDLVADKYHALDQALVEMVQNGIDAYAKNIFVGIDLQQRCVVVLDDGFGITEEKFDNALVNVGNSIKEEGSIGRFGLGMVAPLNKCREFQIVSRPKETNQVLRWLFLGAKIREQRNPRIPMTVLRELPPAPHLFKKLAGRLATSWRTMVLLSDIIKDRTIASVNLDELAQQISAKLGKGMRKYGTNQVLLALIDEKGGEAQTKKVDPLVYTGEPLPIVEYDEPGCGKVVFRLYRAPWSGKERAGKVHVSRLGDVSSISFQGFYTQALGSRWIGNNPTMKEAFDALRSGELEGDIQVANIKIDGDREKFFLDDAVRYSYMVIEQWWVEHGKAFLDEVREERRDERYQKLGQQCLEWLYKLLETQADFAQIRPELQGGEPLDEPDDSALPEPERGEDGKPQRRNSKKRRVVARHPDEVKRKNPSKPRDPRDPVKQGEVRLRLAYERLPRELQLWKLDFESFTLVFNTRHPLWAMCDEMDTKRTARHDRQVKHLQQWLMVEVLNLLARHPDQEHLEVARRELDERTPLYVHGFILRNP